MMAPTAGGNLMRVVTVEDLQPRLDGWDAITGVTFDSAVARLVPFSHFNATSVDTLLDHPPSPPLSTKSTTTRSGFSALTVPRTSSQGFKLRCR
jgi:hypothetical protein